MSGRYVHCNSALQCCQIDTNGAEHTLPFPFDRQRPKYLSRGSIFPPHARAGAYSGQIRLHPGDCSKVRCLLLFNSFGWPAIFLSKPLRSFRYRIGAAQTLKYWPHLPHDAYEAMAIEVGGTGVKRADPFLNFK